MLDYWKIGLKKKTKKKSLETALVISPHPDDETLGCGGTLLRHKYKGDNIYWAIVTEKSEKEAERNVSLLREEMIKIEALLNLAKTKIQNIEDRVFEKLRNGH